MKAPRPSPPALLRRLLERLLPADMREFVTGDRTEEVGLTPAVIAFTASVSVVAGVVFALYPALKAARGRPSEALRAE